MSRNSRSGGNEDVTVEKLDNAGWLVLTGLTALAVAMRFYRLGDLPDGLHYDEAFNGLDALSLLHTSLTDWPVFFDENSGREPLYVWLSSIPHALFGPSIWTARSVSAFSGVLLVPALAWLGWQVAPWLGVGNRQLFSLWCAAALLGLLWSQIFARYGIRAPLFVLLETALFAAMWRAWSREPPTRGAWTIAGLFLGLSFYSYLAARLLPLILLILLGAAWLQDRPRVQRHLPGMLCSLAAALLIAAPLGIYFLQNPLSFSTRISQVLTGIGREEVFVSLGRVLGMFVLRGDYGYVNNLPSRPVLDPLLSFFFLISLGLALHRFWELGRAFLLVGLGMMLLPSVMTGYAPNFLRAIGAMPFTVLFVAFGAERFVRLIGMLWGERTLRLGQVLAWAMFAGATALTGWTYFEVWGSSPAMFSAWAAGYAQLARLIESEGEGRVYISPRNVYHPYPAADPHPAIGYLRTGRGVTPQYHDERFCLRVALEDSARYLSLTAETGRAPLRLDSYFPDSAPRRPVIFDESGKHWATEFTKEKDAVAVFPEMRPYHVNLADGIALRGYRLSPEDIQADQILKVRLFWQVNHTPTQDYTLFLHLLLVNEEGLFAQLAGFDHPPGNGACPMTEWLSGEMIVHEVEMILPAALPPGDLFLAVGFYTPSNGRRMPVSLAADDHILIGPLTRSP
ncbi:MAG: hypothetical protein OXI52_04550 [Caldilineaceae bacterium]|nr:hypothetical protein [Caldilineaceae bacterium]